MRKKGIILLLAALFMIAVTIYGAILVFPAILMFNPLVILFLALAICTSVKLTIMAAKLLRQK